MRYEGLVGGISGCWKTATEEVATTGTNAGDVEGTGTGSIRASCALAGNQLVRDLIRDSTVPSLSLAVNFPRVADRASTSIDFSHSLHKFLFNRQFQECLTKASKIHSSIDSEVNRSTRSPCSTNRIQKTIYFKYRVWK
jgi:hypothetical protein